MNSCVLGAGAWGTAVALTCMSVVIMFVVPRRIDHAMELTKYRENKDYLPVFLPESMQVGYEQALF